MAKAKKGKNDEQNGDSSNPEAVVKHQKLCLSIDMESQRIYGYTEMQIIVPENGIVGLHADNLVIENVTVDGEPAEFEVFPHYQHLDQKDRWCVVSSASSAADASGSVYLSSLQLELLPNLLIMCSKSIKPNNQQQESLVVDNMEQLSADANRLCLLQEVKHIRIEYWVEKAETGIHFDNNVLHTDNQLRRARCWFPCMDESSQCCSYDLEFTVASNFVAVSSGTLLHQVLTKDDPPQKTYVYKLDIPVAAQYVSLAVGAFEILPDQHADILSHFCLPANLSKLQNTMAFFYSAFSHYEKYLSASFPFGSYSQVFIPPEMAISSWSLGASISIFSSHILFDDKIINQIIDTRIKLAHALARQWFGVYITPEAPNDEWLLDGLAGFLSDSFIKSFLGNNEARYRRYKANCAVCQADDSGATALCSSLASKDLYGIQNIDVYKKIRSWKSVAVLQMLEKQMGPESFRKILQRIIFRAQHGNPSLRTLSTKQFRQFANKIGNLERPFLKEFFPRWVGTCGCAVLKMGFSYNKRKNLIELAVLRGCTSRPDSGAAVDNVKSDSDNQESNVGWPGMMSIRMHELDGMYDHPILPMAGEPWQLLEIQCHSKLTAKRFQKPKKSSKADGSDDNVDAVTTTDVRVNSDSPLLWLRADPEMEYLAEVHFNLPVQMWINQLEKDKDVIAQAQAVAVLEAQPQSSFSVLNALNNFLNDPKAFWRVRIHAAYALATKAGEDTDWAGLLHLINFYKSRRYDLNIGLPKPNDFRDFGEYFVLEAIPHTIALVRSSDRKSPREAVEFILQLLKYNDNNGNTYSDVFWLAALVRSVGELELGQQSIVYLPSLLKRLDRLLQFDRLMPSHNGILTVSCIRSLTQISVKLAEFVHLDYVIDLIKPYRESKTWQIRVGASRALLELQFQNKGIGATLTLFMTYLNEEMSLRGQSKLGICALRLCQMANQTDCDNDIKSETLVAFLRLLESPLAFNNVTLRHYIFCILQVLAGRSPTLFGFPRDETLMMGHTKTSSDLKNIFAALIGQSKLPASGMVSENAAAANTPLLVSEAADKEGTSLIIEVETLPDAPLEPMNVLPHDDQMVIDDQKIPKSRNEQLEQLANVSLDDNIVVPEASTNKVTDNLVIISDHVPEASKEADSENREFKKTKLKINLRKPSTSITHVEDPSVSVNDPQPENIVEDANSSHDVGSRLSIGSIKPVIEGDELLLQCTADSSKVEVHGDGILKIDTETQDSEQTVSVSIDDRKRRDEVKGSEGKEKRKHKDKKRKKSGHKDDSEQKRRKKEKKEKKRKEKEIAKILADNKTLSVVKVPIQEIVSSVVNADDVLQGADASIARLDNSGKAKVETIDSRLYTSGNAPVETIDSKLDTSENAQVEPNDYVSIVDNSRKVKVEAIDSAARQENSGNLQIQPSDSGDVELKPNAIANRGDISANPTQSAPSTKIRIKFKSRTLGRQ